MFQFGPQKHYKLEPIFWNGHCYLRTDPSGEGWYVECYQKSREKCPARGFTIDGKCIHLTKVHHNHHENPELELIYSFKRELYITVSTTLHDLRKIYNDISVRHPRASALVLFCNISKTMQLWRKVICPPAPESLEQYVQILNTERWKNLIRPNINNNDNLMANHLTATNGSTAVIFIDPQFITKFPAVDLYIDATYKVCPREPEGEIYQFLTIMSSFGDNVFPIAWSFMSGKSKACYFAVINHFVQLTPGLQVLSLTTDYEIALQSTMKYFYPNAVNKSCYFHYTQALIKKAKKLNLLRKIEDLEDGQVYFQKLIALALLPAEDIQNAFNWLKTVYALFFSIFSTFLEYYQSWWIDKVKPENFSIFGFINRTNNYVEANNRRLNVMFGLHPRIWQFTDFLRRHYETTKIEFDSALMFKDVRRKQRHEYTATGDIFLRIWELYNNDSFDIPHFLECACNTIPLFNNHTINSVDEVDTFINTPIKKFIALNEHMYIIMDEEEATNLQYILLVE